MRTDFQQFYVAPDNVRNGVFYLMPDEARHAARVLRKQVGDRLEAIDGCGRLYAGTIRQIEKNTITVEINEITENVGEPRLKLILAQSVPKGNHFDIVVEKGTEIGVAVFAPIFTERCMVDPASRVERWQHKVQAATKQCGRSRFPEIREPVSLQEFLQKNEYDVLFVAHQSTDNSEMDATIVRRSATAAVLIGPEGGFTPQEVRLAQEAGAVTLNLGPRRLRSETAALVAACKILDAAHELS